MREHQNIFFFSSGSHFNETECMDSKSMAGSLHIIWGKCRGKDNALEIVKNQPPKTAQWSESPAILFYNLCQEINSHNTYALVINILGGLHTLVSLEEVIVFHNHVIWKQKKSSCTFGSMYLTNQQTTQKMAKSWGPSSCVIFWGVTGSSTFFFWFLYHSAYFYVLPLGFWPDPAWSSDRCQSHGHSERTEVASFTFVHSFPSYFQALYIHSFFGGSQAPPSLGPLLHV